MSQYGVFSGPYFPAFGLNMERYEIHLFFVHFQKYLQLFFDDNMDEKSELFSNRKSSASGRCLAFACFFCPFQPGVVYKIIAYKKACISILIK